MASIGIVGAGTAGLHLGLKLLSHGVSVTLYAERTLDEVRSGRLPGTVAHHAVTRERERELGVDHWSGPQADVGLLGIHVIGPQPFGMQARLRSPTIFVDYRVYHPRLAEDFVARGGRLEVLPVDAATLERLSLRHDLMVVAAGRGGLTSLFPRLPELSPHTQPARMLFATLLKGVRLDGPLGLNAHLVPGQGEVFSGPVVTRNGLAMNVFFEALPGSEMAVLATQRYEEDPRAFNALLLDRVRRFAPAVYEHVIPEELGVLGPMDYLQGGFAPVVRRGWAQLGEGRFALAVGDAHVANDPVSGQGANTASACAFVLAACIQEALRSERPFDETFCRDAEAKTWAASAATTHWTNALLQPPPPHIVELLIAGSQEARVAEAIVNTFLQPEDMLAAVATPESTAAFIARSRAPDVLPAPAWQPLPAAAPALRVS